MKTCKYGCGKPVLRKDAPCYSCWMKHRNELQRLRYSYRGKGLKRKPVQPRGPVEIAHNPDPQEFQRIRKRMLAAQALIEQVKQERRQGYVIPKWDFA